MAQQLLANEKDFVARIRLAQTLAEKGELPEEQREKLTEQAADWMDEMHEKMAEIFAFVIGEVDSKSVGTVLLGLGHKAIEQLISPGETQHLSKEDADLNDKSGELEQREFDPKLTEDVASKLGQKIIELAETERLRKESADLKDKNEELRQRDV